MPRVRRLYVHVGLQKTGTSYLQAAMLRGRDALAAQGLDLVPPTKQQSFELMVVVRDRYQARRDPGSDRNILDRFSAQLDAARGSRAVLSQESLAACRPAQVDRLLAAAGDREVHVVLTVRDLARQLPSAWQQELKAGASVAYEDHLRHLQELERSGSGRAPWIHLDPPAVAERWASALSPDRVHVVTVPPPGAPTTELLERFARVLEVEPTALRPEEGPSNTSLGRVQAEVLRRVNAELPEEAHRRWVYGDVVKRQFGVGVLGAQQRRTILVPAALRSWCDEVTERHVAALAAAGYPVEGSLEDLRCRPSSFADEDDRPSDAELAASSVSALTTLLAERAEALASRRTGRIEVATPTDAHGAAAAPAAGRPLLRRLRRRLARR